ncbi:MAG: Na(+) H(+) antiporter subunit A, partial [uncultured Thermomicrobiales bacterium]
GRGGRRAGTAGVGGTGGGGAGRRRVRLRGLGPRHRRRPDRRRLGADLGPPPGLLPRRAGRALRAAGDGDRRGGRPLRRPLHPPPPRPPRPPAERPGPLLRVAAALPRRDGRPRDGRGPAAALRLLGPDRDRLLPPDRLRPRRGPRPRGGPDGPPRHRRQRILPPDRRPAPLRRVRHLPAPRALRGGRGRADRRRRRDADRGRRAGQERPGAAPLLAAAGDGRADARLGLPPLGGDGRGRGLPARAGLPPAGAGAAPARRPAGGRPRLDGGRGRAGADPGRAQAGAGLLDDLPVRLRRHDARPRRRGGRRRRVVLRSRPRPGQVGPVPHRRSGDRGDGGSPPRPARRPLAGTARPRRRQRRGGGQPGRAAAHGRLLQGRAVLRRRARARPRAHRRGGRRRGAHLRLHRPLLGGGLPRAAPHPGRPSPPLGARRARRGAGRPVDRLRGRGRAAGGGRRGGGRRDPPRRDAGPPGLPPRHPRREPAGAGDLRPRGDAPRDPPGLVRRRDGRGPGGRARWTGAWLRAAAARPESHVLAPAADGGPRPPQPDRDDPAPGRDPGPDRGRRDPGRRGLHGRRHRPGRPAPGADPDGGRGGGGRDHARHRPPLDGPDPLRGGVQPGGHLRLLLGAGRRAGRRADRDDLRAPAPRGAGPAAPAGAARGRPRAVRPPPRVAGRRPGDRRRAARLCGRVGGTLPAGAAGDGRRRAGAAHPRRARQGHRDGDPGRLPRPRHDGGDHRDRDRAARDRQPAAPRAPAM